MVYDTFGSKPTEWAGKPYAEIQSIGESDGSIVVVPIGSIEQHGDHLPVSTDTILVDAAAHAGAEAADDDVPVVVTPPIWSGLSSHHMPFGGTLSLEFSEMLELVESVGDSALDNGFDAILLLNGHGGNMSLISTAINKIGEEHPDIEVSGLTYFYLASSLIEEVRDSDPGGMMHGGELETSLMLHLRPELVDEDEMTAVYAERKNDLLLEDLFGSGPLGTYSTFADHTDTGIMGDPTLASAEKGETIFEHIREEMGSLLDDIHEEVKAQD
ncbi:creatininase family protein [Halovenus marina]|uniref:creatininase family protein n=1 Tax=Halovenus marina TaxID=3396621 RepID=UPI003F56110A